MKKFKIQPCAALLDEAMLSCNSSEGFWKIKQMRSICEVYPGVRGPSGPTEVFWGCSTWFQSIQNIQTMFPRIPYFAVLNRALSAFFSRTSIGPAILEIGTGKIDRGTWGVHFRDPGCSISGLGAFHVGLFFLEVFLGCSKIWTWFSKNRSWFSKIWIHFSLFGGFQKVPRHVIIGQVSSRASTCTNQIVFSLDEL